MKERTELDAYTTYTDSYAHTKTCHMLLLSTHQQNDEHQEEAHGPHSGGAALVRAVAGGIPAKRTRYLYVKKEKL